MPNNNSPSTRRNTRSTTKGQNVEAISSPQKGNTSTKVTAVKRPKLSPKNNELSIEEVNQRLISLEKQMVCLKADIVTIQSSNTTLSQQNQKLREENYVLKSSINQSLPVLKPSQHNISNSTLTSPELEQNTLVQVERPEVSINIENLERNSLRSNLVISGLPNSNLDTISILKNIGATISCEVEDSDFTQLYSTSNMDPTKLLNIFVKFKNNEKRNNFFKAYLNYKNLYLTDVIKSGVSRYRIFINEQLTKLDYKIFTKASELRKSGKIQKFFTRSGRVCVVQKDCDNYCKIYSINDLLSY